MPRHARSRAALSALAVCAALPAAANAQATRTWVSGVGDDVNPCSRTSPCKTLAGAQSKTAAWGTIGALDHGGWGSVTITKALTVDVSGDGAGGILVSGAPGVIVNAGATDDVVLRALVIRGSGDCGGATSAQAATAGVRVVQARSVTLEDVTVAQATVGVDVAPSAAAVDVTVSRSRILNACTGIRVAPTGGGSADVLVTGSTVANASTAALAVNGGSLTVADSTLASNALAYAPAGGGTLVSAGNVRLMGNASDGEPTRTIAVAGTAGPRGEPGSAGATGAHGATGATGATGPQGTSAPSAPSASRLVMLVGRPVVGRRSVRMPVALSSRGTVLATVFRGRTRVATILQGVAPGPRAVAWNRRIGRRAAPRGVYTVRLMATAATGAIARGKARVVIR